MTKDDKSVIFTKKERGTTCTPTQMRGEMRISNTTSGGTRSSFTVKERPISAKWSSNQLITQEKNRVDGIRLIVRDESECTRSPQPVFTRLLAAPGAILLDPEPSLEKAGAHLLESNKELATTYT